MCNLIHAREARYNATVLQEDRALQEVDKLIREASLKGLTGLAISVSKLDPKDPHNIRNILEDKGYRVTISYPINGGGSFINVRW